MATESGRAAKRVGLKEGEGLGGSLVVESEEALRSSKLSVMRRAFLWEVGTPCKNIEKKRG